MFGFVFEAVSAMKKKASHNEAERLSSPKAAEVSVGKDGTVFVSWTVCDATADRIFSSVMNAVGEKETYSLNLERATLVGETAEFYVSSLSANEWVTLVLPSNYVP